MTMLVVIVATLSAAAQETVDFRYGCISYDTVLKAMPEYAKAEADLEALKQKYDAETKASEEEFNSKYEVFLSEHANYAPSILRKRQSELEDLMKRNENFRAESVRLLKQSWEEMLKPAKDKLNTIIKNIAAQYSLAFVLNTDSDAVPYLNIDMAYNITAAVEEALKQ
jgi:outer membrane protein